MPDVASLIALRRSAKLVPPTVTSMSRTVPFAPVTRNVRVSPGVNPCASASLRPVSKKAGRSDTIMSFNPKK